MSKETYLGWWKRNKQNILAKEFSLLDKDIIANPLQDKLKGVNLISFLSEEVNDLIDNFLKTFPKEIIENSWIIPSDERHITIFDFIPHNSGLDYKMLLDQAEGVKGLINNIIESFNQEIIIKFNGIIASPDGITLLGYVENDSLNSLRNAIRLGLQEQGLLSLEEIKYKATTAHVSLLKFTQQINPELLIKFIEKNFDFAIATIKLEKLVLTISGRYYKTINSDILQEYKLNAK